MEDLGTSEFESRVNDYDGVALVDFWAEWCGPCKQLEPRLEELSEEYEEIDFYRVNVDENQDLAGQFGIRSIPTLMLFKDGDKVEEIVGAVPKKNISEQLDSHL